MSENQGDSKSHSQTVNMSGDGASQNNEMLQQRLANGNASSCPASNNSKNNNKCEKKSLSGMEEEMPVELNESISGGEIASTSNSTTNDPQLTANHQKKLEDIRRAIDLLKLKSAAMGLQQQQQQQPKTKEEAMEKRFDFWSTQPVPKITETEEELKTINQPIQMMEHEQIPKEAFKLPEGFVWVSLNIDNDYEMQELYTLLFENYVEDDDNMFRFNYGADFLRWVLKPPGWQQDYFVGMRVYKPDKVGKLVGFISAIPSKLRIFDKKIETVEINFLCVHKKLRSKRMAPVLISEVTRRVRLRGVFQALYTAGVYLPRPVSTCRYYHRSLNPKKLIEVGFSHLTRNMNMSRTIKLYRLPENPMLSGLRPFERRDIKQVHSMFTEYMKKFDLVPLFDEEEIAHWLLPQPNIIDSYVVERTIDKAGGGKKKEIVGFFSFYLLPSTVMNNKNYKEIKAAYSFYSIPSEHCSLIDLIQDALIIAKNSGMDVFNALNQRDNDQFLERLKFGSGDGNLHYYLFNWNCPFIKPEKIGVVLQ